MKAPKRCVAWLLLRRFPRPLLHVAVEVFGWRLVLSVCILMPLYVCVCVRGGVRVDLSPAIPHEPSHIRISIVRSQFYRRYRVCSLGEAANATAPIGCGRHCRLGQSAHGVRRGASIVWGKASAALTHYRCAGGGWPLYQAICWCASTSVCVCGWVCVPFSAQASVLMRCACVVPHSLCRALPGLNFRSP